MKPRIHSQLSDAHTKDLGIHLNAGLFSDFSTAYQTIKPRETATTKKMVTQNEALKACKQLNKDEREGRKFFRKKGDIPGYGNFSRFQSSVIHRRINLPGMSHLDSYLD
jgi:hypothetical protein